jgi:penicillin-binding protein 1A
MTQINTDPAMALGTNLVTPLEMSQAYDAFANGGQRVTAYGLERIRTARGRVLYQHRFDAPIQAIANPPLGYMDQMLRGVIASGTGTHAAVAGYDLAGKTGTTSDYKDAWFCGFSGGVTTVVWLGRDDATPMVRVTGGSAPAELWRDYMKTALPRLHAGPIPPGPAAPPPPVEITPVDQSAPAAPAPTAAPSASPLPPMR